jgi:predicted ArsR family transcriptional regulator
MVVTEAQLRALSSPTRLAIFRCARAAAAPVTVAQIAADLGIDASAVRRQIGELVRADLLSEEREHSGRRGRPVARYASGPAATELVGVGPLEQVACMLADLIAGDEDPIAIGRRYATVRSTTSVNAVDALTDELTLHGFAPERVRRGGRTEIVLHRCPFASVAQHAPSTVCALHLGLIEGTADALGAPNVIGFHPKDPRRAGCRVVLDEAGSRGD